MYLYTVCFNVDFLMSMETKENMAYFSNLGRTFKWKIKGNFLWEKGTQDP